MDSWWELGEGFGFQGTKLELWKIQCPFCLEKGNFVLEHHSEKKKPNSDKKLNFDTYKCNSCAGYVLVLWSASEYGLAGGLYSMHVLPYPIKFEEAPEYWPEGVSRFWLQAHRCLQDDNWDAAAVMARSALQAALRNYKAEGRNLKQEIDDLGKKGILPPIIKDWSNNIRELGNDSAHPMPDQAPTAREDASEVVKFLDFLMEYLYTLPKRINDYRQRRSTD
jgi:hypothetical protein